MAGGIAILLLIIVLVVVGGMLLGLYGTGGFLWFRKTDPDEDKVARVADEPSGEDERRPQHTQPTTTAQERTDFVGREPRPNG
jgi:hypothetical protein